MAITFVTGASGAGKTSVARELNLRGYQAYDTDDPNRTGMAGWHNLETGEYVAGFNEVELTESFQATHLWRLTDRALGDFADRSLEERIFLCGALKEPEPVRKISSGIVFLALSSEVIEQRLTQRAQVPGEVTWGREPWQIAYSIERNKVLESEYRQLGAIIIDAMQPREAVVDDIVRATSS